MKAQDVMDHFQKVGTWVNWERTCDQFLHGDPDADVNGIATTWIPTNHVIRHAADNGLNLIVTHEQCYVQGYVGSASGDRVNDEKRALLDEHGMTVMRCHTTWDRMPDVGIPDAWAEFLGFETEPRPTESYYKVCLCDGLTVEEVGGRVLEKVRELGQDWVLVFGDRRKAVRRMAVGTGAITNLPEMYELDVDLILATDDGMNTWDGGTFAADLGVPLLIVNHATAEKPGMRAMAEYLKEVFPGVPAEHVDVEFPWRLL